MASERPSAMTSDIAHDSPEIVAFATRMYNAARAGDVSILQPALTAGLPPNLTSATTGDTLIMLSSYHGHLAATKLLLSHGADPNRLNDKSQSPLSGAVFKGEEEIVEALLEGGADVDVGEPSAWRCLEIFGKVDVWGGRFERQREIVKNGGKVEGVGGMKEGTKIV